MCKQVIESNKKVCDIVQIVKEWSDKVDVLSQQSKKAERFCNDLKGRCTEAERQLQMRVSMPLLHDTDISNLVRGMGTSHDMCTNCPPAAQATTCLRSVSV